MTYLGATVFDGRKSHEGLAVVVDHGRVEALLPQDAVPLSEPRTTLDGGVLCPGFVDLQVNGGGGVLFNDDQSVPALQCIAEAHQSLGATVILPTLITDTTDKIEAAIAGVEAACAKGIAGIAGLHLEGPHLSVARKGAHDADLIRAMEEEDVLRLLEAAQRLPVVMTTVAPESVSPSQISRLAAGGVIVSLGHSDAPFAVAQAAADAGARCVTHLFNAMSQLGSREPGLVGAALACGGLSAGMIADGVHVHPETVGLALAAKNGPGRVFLVSDSMSVAGTTHTEFELNRRKVYRRNGRLTLADGTLAGADLDLLSAARNLIEWGHATPDQALSMVTSCPAGICGLSQGVGTLAPGAPARLVHLEPDLSAVRAVF